MNLIYDDILECVKACSLDRLCAVSLCTCNIVVIVIIVCVVHSDPGAFLWSSVCLVHNSLIILLYFLICELVPVWDLLVCPWRRVHRNADAEVVPSRLGLQLSQVIHWVPLRSLVACCCAILSMPFICPLTVAFLLLDRVAGFVVDLLNT
jgi:hypothetical protein